jgi:hypothetical protein
VLTHPTPKGPRMVFCAHMQVLPLVIHTNRCCPCCCFALNRGAPVRCLAASPALDVVGVGLADGRAILHNLRYDEQVMVLHNAAAAGTNAGRFLQGTAAANAAAASSAAVTCLSFRTGGWPVELTCVGISNAPELPLVCSSCL